MMKLSGLRLDIYEGPMNITLLSSPIYTPDNESKIDHVISSNSCRFSTNIF